MTNKQIDLISATPIFRTEKALDRIADVWGVKIKPTPSYTEARGKAKKLATLQNSTPPVNVGQALAEAPLGKWEEVLKGLAEEDAATRIIRDHGNEATRYLNARVKDEMNSAAMFEAVIRQLPVAETEEKFKQAVLKLGDRVWSMTDALDFDAEALATVRSAGRKLLSLQYLNTGNKVQHFTSALFFEPNSDLPELKVEEGTRLTNYNQADLDEHQAILNARRGVLDRGTWLIESILLNRPGIEFEVAQDWEDVLERSQVYSSAGNTIRVPRSGAAKNTAVVW